jgi:hypothetical protein
MALGPDPNPDRQREILLEKFRDFFEEEDAKIAENEKWGLPGSLEDGAPLPEGVFSFDQAVEQAWCSKHHTVRELLKFLKGVRYPGRFLKPGVIAKEGYAKALKDAQDARRKADAKRKREKRKAEAERKRKAQSPQTRKSANQVPEPRK